MKLSYKISAVVAAVLFSVAAILSAVAEDDVNKLIEKPVFFVSIEARDISFMVGINGNFAYAEYAHEGQVSLDVPVNQYMHPAENILSLEASPPKKGGSFNPSGQVNVELRVRASGDFDTSYLLATMSFSSDEEFRDNHGPRKLSSELNYTESQSGDAEVGGLEVVPSSEYEGSVKAVRTIKVSAPFPEWAFFTSEDLPNYYDFDEVSDQQYEKDLRDILVEYRKIYDAIEKGNTESIISMFAERNEETDKAFYRSAGETERTIRESLEEAAGNDDLELLALEADYVSLHPERNGKVVSLRREGMDPAIILNYKDGSGSVSYPLFFRKEDGKWILTR